MACKSRVLLVSLLSLQLAVPTHLLFAQQVQGQTQTSVSESVDDDYGQTYISRVAQENKLGPAFFQPNASDLLIQQAEERYRQGKQFLRENNPSSARKEFDAAIDLMFRASDNPTSRQIFESKFEDMVEAIHQFDLSSLGAAIPEDGPRFDKAPLEDIVTMTFPVDPKIKDKVKTEVAKTQSTLPLVLNDVVLGYINYFSGRGRRTIEGGLERSGRYRDMITRIFTEEGVPVELIHLAQAESGFLPRAVSKAAAMGMWQFVKFRGNEYGLHQTPYSDDRLDPEQATRAAARHLKDLHEMFHDWYLAVAAYNCGPGTVAKAVERTGYADYWELRARRVLPAETTNYVPIILAMTIMAKNASEYGLDHLTPDAPLEYDTVQVGAPTHLGLVADITDTPVTQIQQINPALFKSLAPAGYGLHVPKGMGPTVAAALEAVPDSKRISWRMHKVEPGEDFPSIAKQFRVPASTLLAVNHLTATAIPVAGDRIIIPTTSTVETAVKRLPARAGARSSKTAVARATGPKATARKVTARKPVATAAVKQAARKPVAKGSVIVAKASHKASPAH